MKTNFNRQERAILKVAFEEQRVMSVKEIAEKAQMSWVTARKYVENLLKRGWLLSNSRKVKFNYLRLGIKRRAGNA